MKTSTVSFEQLRRLLLELEFTEAAGDGYWRFEHSESGSIFVFRPYTSDEHVTMQDLASTRTHLDWRGLVSGQAFDDSLRKTPA